MQAIAIIATAVFVVLSLLLFNPWAAASILTILMCMTIQLAGEFPPKCEICILARCQVSDILELVKTLVNVTGFLGWAGIKLNPVSAVTLITAVGIGTSVFARFKNCDSTDAVHLVIFESVSFNWYCLFRR